MIARALILVALAPGCLLKPDKIYPGDGRPMDGSPGDAPSTPPVPRVIANAYFSGSGNTPGMTMAKYSIPTDGIVVGDLVVFIANIDNGSNSMFMPPDAGFHELGQVFYVGDQTYAAFSKYITTPPPATYMQAYTTTGGSAAAAITLLAIAGARDETPGSTLENNISAQNPVFPNSTGVATIADNSIVIFAAGANWSPSGGVFKGTAPDQFTELVEFGDHGGPNFDWSTMFVAWHVQATAGPSGPISAELEDTTANCTGEAWMMAIAVAPP